MKRLFLDAGLRSQIEGEARTAYPRECCGLIEGTRNAEALRVIALRPTRNVAADPNRFEIDPAEHFEIVRVAREKGTHIIGCYHSHPNAEARPSLRDHDGASEDGFIWLIASLSAAGAVALNAFVWRGQKFEPITIAHDGTL